MQPKVCSRDPRRTLTPRPLVSAVRVQQHGDGHAHVLGAAGHHHVLPQRGNTCRNMAHTHVTLSYPLLDPKHATHYAQYHTPL